jgi:aminomethyltransferase
MTEQLKKTPLFEKHVTLGAKMAPFGGYLMPIQYKSIIAEHTAAREDAALFDTCHMGEFSFSGPSAVEDLEHLLSCPVATMETGQCRYGFICNESGGVIDDQILYRQGGDRFFMVVNAATESSDFEWIIRGLSASTNAENISGRTAKIDLQGPAAPRICARLMEAPVNGLRYYRFIYNRYQGENILLSRTGYTGEIGFEFYGSPELIASLWEDCVAAGAQPAGLGARDTLRLEMGFPLYGHELDTETSAAWSGFSRALADKYYVGSEAIAAATGMGYILTGFLMEGRRAAHQGNPVTLPEGKNIGHITSGSYAPSLGHAVAVGYIAVGSADAGDTVLIQTERGALRAEVASPPFYRRATGRRKLEEFL